MPTALPDSSKVKKALSEVNAFDYIGGLNWKLLLHTPKIFDNLSVTELRLMPQQINDYLLILIEVQENVENLTLG